MQLFKKTLLFFLSLFIFSAILPQSTHAQQYIVKPYLVVPSDWNTPEQQALIPAQQQDILQALKETQAWFARTVNGKTFNLDENVRVILDEDRVGERRLANESVDNLLPASEGNVINIVWVVGLWFGRGYGQASFNGDWAIMSYDALLDLRSERSRNFSLKVTAHELGHTFDLVQAGFAHWHPCTEVSEKECVPDAPRPFPAANEWNGSIMGQASRDLTAGLNNSAHNPELWKIYKSPFINPQGDPPPEPSPLPPPPTTQITSLFPNPVEVGQILTVKGAGFGDAAGSFQFLRENGSFTEAKQIPEWTDEFIRVVVDESAAGASFIAILPKSSPEGEAAVVAKISIIRSEPLPYLTINYSTTCGENRERLTDATVMVTSPRGGGIGSHRYFESTGTINTTIEEPGRYIVTANSIDNINPQPAEYVFEITNTQLPVSHSVEFNYPQCPVTIPHLSYDCSQGKMLASWSVGEGICETSIVAGSNLHPIHDSCRATWADTVFKDVNTGALIPFVNGGTYQLAIKRNGQIVGTSYKTTVQCNVIPSPTPTPTFTPTATPTLSYSCGPTRLVANWSMEPGNCEADIIAGSTFYPVSIECNIPWTGEAIKDKSGNYTFIANGGTYQLAVKRNGRVVATSERVTVQCATVSPAPTPIPTPISGPGVCPNPNLKPEDTPTGYKWEADCNASCTENENCGTGATGQANWCYGFEGGARCLRLEPIANQSPTFTSTPQQSAAASCENEVLNIAKGRGAPDNRLNDIASDVCGRGTLDLFKNGCDKGVIYGEVPGTQCEGQQSQPAPEPPQKRIISVTVNNQSLALDSSSGVDFSLPGKIGQAQLFSVPVVVQYSDGSSKLFFLKFNYLKVQQGAAGTPSAPGKCDPNFVPATPPPGNKWKTDCNISCSGNSDCGEYELGKQNWCYGFTDGAKCIRLEKEGGGGGSGSLNQGLTPSDSCKTEVKSIAKSRNAPDSRLDDIANDVCGRGTLDLFKKGCDKGVIYGEVPGADCGANSTSGSSPSTTAQPVKDTSKGLDCGTKGGNHCADANPANLPAASRECQNLGTTFDCVGGCFKCK